MTRDKVCIYDKSIECNHCFKCIEDIAQKTGGELSVHETAKLMEYKLYKVNLGNFADTVNKYLKQMVLYIKQLITS